MLLKFEQSKERYYRAHNSTKQKQKSQTKQKQKSQTSQTKGQSESTKGTVQNDCNEGKVQLMTQQRVAGKNVRQTNAQKKGENVASHSQTRSQNGTTTAGVQSQADSRQNDVKPKVVKKRKKGKRRWKGKRKTAAVDSSTKIKTETSGTCGSSNQHGVS